MKRNSHAGGIANLLDYTVDDDLVEIIGGLNDPDDKFTIDDWRRWQPFQSLAKALYGGLKRFGHVDWSACF